MEYSVHMMMTSTLYYEGASGCLISTVCKYRNYSLLASLITSLTICYRLIIKGRWAYQKRLQGPPSCPDRFIIRIRQALQKVKAKSDTTLKSCDTAGNFSSETTRIESNVTLKLDSNLRNYKKDSDIDLLEFLCLFINSIVL